MGLAVPAGRHARTSAFMVLAGISAPRPAPRPPSVCSRLVVASMCAKPRARCECPGSRYVPHRTRRQCTDRMKPDCSPASFRIAASSSSTPKTTCRSRTSRRGRSRWPRGAQFSRAAGGRLCHGHKCLPLGTLTPRERAVLERIAEGLDNSEIAGSLSVRENGSQSRHAGLRQDLRRTSISGHRACTRCRPRESQRARQPALIRDICPESGRVRYLVGHSPQYNSHRPPQTSGRLPVVLEVAECPTRGGHRARQCCVCSCRHSDRPRAPGLR